MKRANSECDEPEAKIARLDADAKKLPAFDRPWWFIAADEDGGLDTFEWDPASSKKKEEVGAALVAAHVRSRTMELDEDGYPQLYFQRVFGWCAFPKDNIYKNGEKEPWRPDEFKGIEKEEVGTIEKLKDGEAFHDGPTFTYIEWC